MKRLIFFFISIIVLVALAVAFWVGRVKIKEVYQDVTRPELPEAVGITEVEAIESIPVLVQSEPPVVPPCKGGPEGGLTGSN